MHDLIARYDALKIELAELEAPKAPPARRTKRRAPALA